METWSTITSTESHFVIENRVVATADRNGVTEKVADRTFHDEIPRTSA